MAKIRNRRFPKHRGLNGSQQSAKLSFMYPGFRQIRRGKVFVWVGHIQPTPLSNNYRVRIRYLDGARRPSVSVLEPPLIKRNGEKIPHTFKNGRLCLHVKEEWTPHSPIATTIIPWISSWLFYYEVWHATGKWLGGGHEPEADDDIEPV